MQKILLSIGIGLLCEIIMMIIGGKEVWHIFINQDFPNPDSNYVLDLIWQYRHNNAILGSNPSILPENHLSYIHWSSFYLIAINICAKFFHIFMTESNSILYGASFITVLLGFLYILIYVICYYIIIIFNTLFNVKIRIHYMNIKKMSIHYGLD